MATTTKKPAAKKAATRRPASKKPAGGSATKKSTGGSRALQSLRENVGDRRVDLLGVALLAMAVLLGLALYADSGGVVGNWLAAAALGFSGRLAYLVPLSLFYTGVLALFADGERETPRILIGMTLVWVGVLGLWHLVAGAPQPNGDVTSLYDAAGLLGHVISRPLAVGLSPIGAGLLLAVVTLLGSLVWTKTSFREFGALLGRGLHRSRREVSRVVVGDRTEQADAKAGKRANAKRRAETKADAKEEAKADRAWEPHARVSLPDDDDAAASREAPSTSTDGGRRRGLLRRRGATRGPAEETNAPVRPSVLAPPSTVAPADRPPAPDPVRAPAAPTGATSTSPAPAVDLAQAEAPMFGGRPVTRAGAVNDADGLTAADRAAGRIPAPIQAAVPDPRAVARYTDDGQRKAKKVAPKGPAASMSAYRLPSLDGLATGRSAGAQSERHIAAQVEALQETFDQFKIDATVARHSRGPTVTTYEIELGAGVPVKKVANLGDDIAYALAAPDVRIVAPIPGKSAIGVEVPNRMRDRITLGDILRSDTAKADPHPLLVALGVDSDGHAAMVNLATMPHLLVSGATGSGKSVTLNSMITSIIARARPDQVRMILVDPKRVELNSYDGAPHLLTPVVTDPKRAADAIQWAVKEMELRYNTLARLGYRNIDGYNDAVAADALPLETPEEKATYRHMPYILLVIDELADLMLVAPRDVEESICRIAQMARAVGIHMVIATQRPSVDVITGLIKANIPSRLALAVSSQTDSRTILDMGGAEKLVGHGDMLFLPASQGKPSRLQGCFVSETEILPLIKHCAAQREATYVEGVVKSGEDAAKVDQSRGGDDDTDEALLRRAAMQVAESGLGSVSMLQRKLRIGFARAGRLMDELEEIGVVGPNEGSKARDVLWSPEMVQQGIDSDLL